ncbi:MAG: M15 family metallopeptidase [Fimbriimonadales bacterium]
MKVSSHEPVTQLKRIPIVECGEPLVDYVHLCPKLLIAKPRWRYERATLLRRDVAHRLCRAAESLPDGYRLAIVEGWRPPHIQRRMYRAALRRWKEIHPDWSDLALRRLANRFTAPPNIKVPPPHTTGGVFDLLLADGEGSELDHSSPYESRDRRAYPFAAPGLTKEARSHREILREALESAGITNYPSEYWHWSYGDQGWAYRGGHLHAIYGPTAPPGYVPPPGDDTDEPLEWVGS